MPKSNRGKPLERTRYKYLDVVHVNIAFGDCLSIGGFRHALILVDQATLQLEFWLEIFLLSYCSQSLLSIPCVGGFSCPLLLQQL
jgi:hypothetical protein